MQHANKHLLVLDLDETLVHSSYNYLSNADLVLSGWFVRVPEHALYWCVVKLWRLDISAYARAYIHTSTHDNVSTCTYVFIMLICNINYILAVNIRGVPSRVSVLVRPGCMDFLRVSHSRATCIRILCTCAYICTHALQPQLHMHVK